MIHCKSCRCEKNRELFINAKGKILKTCQKCLAQKKRAHAQKVKNKVYVKSPKLSIGDCHKAASGHGGKCLSKKYKDNRGGMLWECSEGHQWSTTFKEIRRKHWCPNCAGILPLTIEECQNTAAEKGGVCLSVEYKNAQTKMEWKCGEGHNWLSKYNHIKSGHWCSKCGDEITGDATRLTIEECQDVAAEKGGKCLSIKYVNNRAKMLWECKERHQWYTSMNNIKNGNNWCPQCKHGRSEKLTREIFERLTGYRFPNVRPKWMQKLELDGYCEELNLAWEYQGEQHYRYVPHFHRNGDEDLHEQQARDHKKIEICLNQRLPLILIPYKFNYTNPNELEMYICIQLMNCGL